MSATPSSLKRTHVIRVPKRVLTRIKSIAFPSSSTSPAPPRCRLSVCPPNHGLRSHGFGDAGYSQNSLHSHLITISIGYRAMRPSCRRSVELTWLQSVCMPSTTQAVFRNSLTIPSSRSHTTLEESSSCLVLIDNSRLPVLTASNVDASYDSVVIRLRTLVRFCSYQPPPSSAYAGKAIRCRFLRHHSRPPWPPSYN